MNRSRRKDRADRWTDIKGGMAFIVPVALTRHESYRLMTPYAHKLFADLSTQYSGFNNGYLCAAWTLMEPRGWKSRTTLAKAAAELEHYRIIERTQQGGRNRPNLYAFTFRRIDRIEGRRLDVAATPKPSDAWDGVIAPFVYRPKRRNTCPPSGLEAREQAHAVDSVCPPAGLGNADKPTGWASSARNVPAPSPRSGHLTIVTSSRDIAGAPVAPSTADRRRAPKRVRKGA